MSEEVTLYNNTFLLCSEKAVLWKSEGVLLISDLHLGKVNHFRRSGIAVPHNPNDQNIERLITLLQEVQPDRVLFMGDLFHSHYNTEWEVFGQVLKCFPAISFELVMGNHDIMSDYQYQKHQLVMHKKPLEMGAFIMSHEPLEGVPEGCYNFAGHIHPGVHLRGKGRQGIKLPCFYFGKNQALLPAFGEFTGLYKIKPKVGDQVFVIVDGKVIKV
ncbi:ligase-associated DNA damage response endonuclease PdeM [Fulvivirga sp. 29W222]|uniref:Ligase-associated DNA damage response endonuclease PdeM n=1 Tax=Fulvivirga marina TaxID=2494733 RepID=A0A937FT66_9BACT|nr:ligase-associated DNA damage response endonuclease PdeM [Fulvivirga marina]MBL6445210.1 ligase-associated DNA damage response endonuclease PdeM [Fulvivirga marina]